MVADIESADVLVDVPVSGRVFAGFQRVRLGDITPGGVLRLDAAVRYLQDVANDDAYDSGIENPAAWVVRRTVVEVRRPAVLREDLELRTFCSGMGASWAERRTSIRGAAGASIEAAALWVQLDPTGGRPQRLDDGFRTVYGPSAGGRTVTARLRLSAPVPAGATVAAFALRDSDLDVMGHVNNAVYWSMIDECFGGQDGALPARYLLEHHGPLDRGATVRLCRVGERLWILDGDTLAAAAQRLVTPAGQPVSR